MNRADVRVRELAGWGFDDYKYRPHAQYSCADHLAQQRPAFWQQSALLLPESETHHDALQLHVSRPDLLDEMKGLEWSLGIVDLRRLLAFQRRLVLNPRAPERSAPDINDLPGLIDFCFPRLNPIVCDSVRKDGKTLVLSSENPNLHLRMETDTEAPIQIHGGSPFIEVARYRGRWFLRDGYHRAYTLLQNGVCQVPAVVVKARTLAELGATRPWFFSEDILFSTHPPQVTDFLDDSLTICYERVPLIKTIRVSIEESFAPESISGEREALEKDGLV
jgi:hypothetical protein